MKRIIKQFSLIVIAALVLSMLPATALSGNISGIDSVPVVLEHEISVMSFNVLDYVAADAGYALPYQRAPYVVATVKKYMPDLIGFQEAGDPQSQNGNFNWNNYLASELKKLGYSTRKISEESVHPATMTISAGLMICYKTDRFTFDVNGANSHGSAQYDASYTSTDGKLTKKETARYYQYIKLYDKLYQTDLYMFNTHLSISQSSFGDESSRAGQSLRTQEAIQLRNKMKELATDLPCFATGDYNCSYNSSVEDLTAYNAQLHKMSEGTPFISSAKVALANAPVDYGPTIDHCFINQNYTEVLYRVGVYDDTDSFQPSDHRAIMSYMNYRGRINFKNGSYDPANAVFTDTVTEPTYTFDITPATSAITYKIIGATGNTVDLKAGENNFTIEVYNKGKRFHTVSAAITYNTEIIQPVLTAEDGSAYFSNGAYFVAVSGDSVHLSMENAAFYHNATGTIGGNGTYNSVPLGKSAKSVRVGGILYPLYLMRETLPAENGVYYLDDDIKDVASGTLAAYEDTDGVRFVTIGQNGFGTLPAVIAAAPTGSTIRVAPGTYPDHVSYTNKNLTILGNQSGVDPLDTSENSWELIDRGEESLFTGTINSGSGASRDMTLTIDGCAFSGITPQGPINVQSSNVKYAYTLNVANCIFNCSTTSTVNGSFINLNTRSKKYGEIRNNYFCATRYDETHFIRWVTMRNAHGILFERNYCRMITSTYMSAEIANSNTSAGYNNVTLAYNRFEECSSISFYQNRVYDGSQSHLKIYYNDFIRCGYRTSNTLYFNLNEPAGKPIDYKNCSLTLFGNRFINCKTAAYITRTTDLQNDMRDMKITIQQNRFSETNSFNRGNTIRLYVYPGKDNSVNLACPNWKINYNYMFSSSVSETDPYNPAFYINNTVTVDGTIFTPAIPVTAPYYTDINFTALSSGSAQRQTTLLNDVKFTYDGTAKTLPLPELPEGSAVSYSLDGTTYSTVAPSFTDPGRYIVYYEIDRIGYLPLNGSALLTIESPVITDVTLTGYQGKYDGTPHSVTLNGLKEQDGVTFTADGTPVEQAPAFTEPGRHTVTVTVERQGYKKLTLSADIVIEKGIINNVSLQSHEGVYNGKSHFITMTGILPSDSLTYSLDGGEYTASMPKLTEIGYYTVSVRISRQHYEDLILTSSVAIADAPESCPLTIALTNANGTLTAVFDTANTFDPASDIKILAQGIISFATETDAEAYRKRLVYHTETNVTPATQTTLNDEMGLPRLTPTLTADAPTFGASLAVVTYEYNGIIYTLATSS